ncbi:YrdB family protein [Actinomadura sp. DC4]|uniref:YrdB family protein n=1 Tax=Actinomadura sp. DC4 TaxID=3055069 RepID=UPI0025AF55C1|nr:YrdB family protein [Actinomadura sp. DC4]MDN3354660.1 YrdB family protein [Actinomadura sp. DC4]
MRALSSTREHPAYRAEATRVEAPGVLRFLSEIVAWVATPWALATHSPVLAGVALLLLIGLPTVFVTPGDKVKVVVPVSGKVTISLAVLQLLAAVLAAWAAWPVPVAVLVWILVGITVYAELPRWRRLVGGELVLDGSPRMANEGLAFLIELLALASLAWWGASTGSGLVVHLLLGIGTPLVAAVVWGAAASPKATVRLPLAGVLAVKALVFGAALFGLDGLGHRTLAVLFGVVAAANTTVAAVDREAVLRRASEAGADDSTPALG